MKNLPGHHLHPCNLALRLQTEFLLVAPGLVLDSGRPDVLHDQLLDDLPRHQVLDGHGELVRQMEGEVAQRHDGRQVVLVLVLQQVLLDYVEDVGEDLVLALRAVHVHALDGLLGLLGRAQLDELGADLDQDLLRVESFVSVQKKDR